MLSAHTYLPASLTLSGYQSVLSVFLSALLLLAGQVYLLPILAIFAALLENQYEDHHVVDAMCLCSKPAFQSQRCLFESGCTHPLPEILLAPIVFSVHQYV